jgi:LL-diaminopimelate aminotransferase
MAALKALGYPVEPPRATIYVWLPIPRRFSASLDFTGELLDKCGVLVSPGSGFGAAGEGYVRIAMCVSEERLREVGERMSKAGLTY